MEFTIEIDTAIQSMGGKTLMAQELSELQLAFVGGGTASVIIG